MIDRMNTDEKILKNSAYVLREIEQQPTIWMQTYELIQSMKNELQEFLKDYDEVIFTGAGTSEFVGNTVYRSLCKNGNKNVYSIGTTDLLSHPQLYFDDTKKTVLVSCARSGNSPESVAVVELANQYLKNQVKHLILTCNPLGKLAQYGKQKEHALLVLMPEGTNDLSYAMTSSFTSMVLSGYLCFHLDSLDQQLPYVDWIVKNGNAVLNTYSSDLKKIVNERAFDRLIYLGSGNLKGLAQEAALKALELSAGKLCTMYDSPLGYRHGPASFVKERFSSLIVCLFAGDEYADAYTLDMLKEMRGYENEHNFFLVMAPDTKADYAPYCDGVVKLAGTNIPECYLALPYILAAQLIAVYRSWLYGIGCDIPFGTYETTSPVKTIIHPKSS